MNGPLVHATPGGLSSTWISGIDLRLITESVGTPVFVYSEAQLRKNVSRIQAAAAEVGLGGRIELYVPFFPNANPHVLAPLRDLGAGILVQLPAEHAILQRFGFEKFIVSPGHVGNEEIDFWARTGLPTFLASLDEVRYALRTGAPSVSVRIDSLDSGKPGIKKGELDDLVKLLHEYDRNLESFEVYCGSGNSRDDMVAIIETLFTIYAEYFPHVRSINFAGGHGYVYEEWDEDAKHFDWGQYLRALREVADRMRVPEHVRFLFEPARDVLADTGVLVMSVKRGVISNPVCNIVVTDGSRMLMPSAQLRDRRHNIAFLDESMRQILPDDITAGLYAAVRGRTILRNDYILPGEYWVPGGVGARAYMLVLDVGAYCATQHMEFLNVPPAAEVLMQQDGSINLITSRGGDLDKWRHLLDEKKKLERP